MGEAVADGWWSVPCRGAPSTKGSLLILVFIGVVLQLHPIKEGLLLGQGTLRTATCARQTKDPKEPW